MDTIKCTIESFGKKRSFEIYDGSTWLEVMDEFLSLITAPGMYVLDREKLIAWAENTEVFDD